MKPRTSARPQVVVLRNCCEGGVTLRLAEKDIAGIATLFKALGDPARLQILDILSQRGGEVCVCDFAGVVGLPDAETGERPKQPTISHHLKVLRDAGLIDGQKRGLWVYYTVRRERLAEVLGLLQAFAAETPEAESSTCKTCG